MKRPDMECARKMAEIATSPDGGCTILLAPVQYLFNKWMKANLIDTEERSCENCGIKSEFIKIRQDLCEKCCPECLSNWQPQKELSHGK